MIQVRTRSLGSRSKLSFQDFEQLVEQPTRVRVAEERVAEDQRFPIVEQLAKLLLPMRRLVGR